MRKWSFCKGLGLELHGVVLGNTVAAVNAEPEASARAGIRECERCLWKWYGE